MNKFVTSISLDGNENVTQVVYEEKYLSPVIKSLYRNNSFFPAIKNIIQNGKYTKMFFVDGTSVSVKATDGFKRDANGNVVIDKKTGKPKMSCTPDEPVLEVAIAFCVFKRLFGKPDEKGEIIGDGFASFLKKIVKEKVFDQGKFDAEEKARRLAKQEKKRQAEKKSCDCTDGCCDCKPSKDGNKPKDRKWKEKNNIKRSFSKPNRDRNGKFSKKA